MSPSKCEHPFETNRLDGTVDFFPDWDVPTLGQTATAALTRDIEAVRARTAPDPARRIHLLRGPAGYGKTHLFGRVKYEQGDKVQFAFASSVPDADRATEFIRYQVVETLFHSVQGAVAPIRRHLAQLLKPSIAAYLDQLPAGLRARCTELRQSLANDTDAVLEIVNTVHELAPYQVLADSVRREFPELPGGVVRALVLGLSNQAAEDARVWLRGEANQISDERLRQLRLDQESAGPEEILRAIATFLSRIEVPLVICLDQLDQIYIGSAKGFQELTGQLMIWLAKVPNLVLVLGCVDSRWQEILGEKALAAFADRIRVHALPPLDAAAARELIVRRLRSWENHEPYQQEGWPFDLASVEKFVQRMPISPRAFIDRCKLEFDKWDGGGKSRLISLEPGGGKIAPLADLFRQEWHKLLTATKAGLKAAADYQDAELWAGFEQALQVAQLGEYVPDGIRFERYQRQALRTSPNDSRPSAELHLEVGNKRVSVVLAVNKKDGGQAFGKWVEALEQAMGGTVAGAVVAWPKAKLTVGKTAKAYKAYQERVVAKLIRPFPLDENEETFAQLECLRKLIADAESGMVLVGGETLSADRCRRLLVETKVLAELPLFEMLFENWPALETVRGRAAATTLPSPDISSTTAAARADTPVNPPLQPPASAASVSSTAAATSAETQQAPVGGHPWATQMLHKVVEKLRSRGQWVRPQGVEVGPTFVRLKVEPTEDTDFGKVKRQADNLKLHLSLEVKPVIGNRAGFISIDVVRPDRQMVALEPVLANRPAELASAPAFPLGIDVAGHAQWLNLAEPATCHLLVAGTTGSGKSQLLKSVIAALCDQLGPDHLQFILIDPKQVTFTFSGSSPYLASPIVFDAADAVPLMSRCYQEMEHRYALLRKRGKEHLGELASTDVVPRWVVIFDEFADLMLGDRAVKKELETHLKRLGAKARAAGIHLILGTQRPEASVVTPLLRANLPGRVSLQVASERESKLILDDADAAHLLDKGDLLWRRGGNLVRLQSPYVTREELEGRLRLH